MSNQQIVKKSLPEALARISDSRAMRKNAKKWSSDKNKNVNASKAANTKNLSELWSLTEAYINEELSEQSKNTYLNYYSALKQFLLYAEAEGINLLKPEGAVKSYIRDLEAYGLEMFFKDETGELILAPEPTEAYLKQVKKDNKIIGLSRSSVGVKVAALKTLYAALRHFLDKEDAERLYPLLEIKLKKDTKAAHEKRAPYSEDNAALLLEVAEDAQDKALVSLLALAGLRISEALSLTWGAIDWDAHKYSVVRKGNKHKTNTMNKMLEEALWELRGETLGSNKTHIFSFRTPHAARYRLKKLCKLAGIEYLAAHSLRHTAGTKYYKETGDIKATADFMNHSPNSYAVTSNYVHYANSSGVDETAREMTLTRSTEPQ